MIRFGKDPVAETQRLRIGGTRRRLRYGIAATADTSLDVRSAPS